MSPRRGTPELLLFFGCVALSTFATAPAAAETAPFDPAAHDWKTEIEQAFGLQGVGADHVEQGYMRFVVEEDCSPIIEKYGSCFGNNPASPYGTYVFGDYSEPEDNFRWRLAENQAVMFIGRTPPKGKYFSFQLYPFSRHVDMLRDPPADEDGLFCDVGATPGVPCLVPRQTLLGKMSLNLSHLELLTDDGGTGDPFDKFTIVVTTANAEVESRILDVLPDVLADLGLPPDIINIDQVPCPQATPGGTCDDSDERNLVLGSEPEADDFIMTLRIAMTESLVSQQSYLQNPPATVLRVTFPDLATTFSGYRWADEPPEPSSELYNEDDYRQALRWLTETVRDAYAPDGHIAPFNRGGRDYYDCLLNEKACNAGSEDAYYSKGPNIPADCTEHGLSVLVVGVNHSLAGPYSYSSLSIRDPNERHEVGYFADTDYIKSHYADEDPPVTGSPVPPPYLEGSVEHFLPSAVYPRPAGLVGLFDNLYIAEVAPSCDPIANPHCLEVPLEKLSGGKLGFQERIYSNTEAGTRGVPENFILARLVVPNGRRCGVIGPQLPGDCNQDGVLDISDVICLLGNLFLGDPPTLPCEDVSKRGTVSLLDSNGDGQIDMTDPLWVLGFLMLGTPPPVLGTECTDIVGCPANENCK